MELLLKQIYKYQKFSGKAILENINILNFKKNSVAFYINAVRRYLEDGTKTYKSGLRFYEILDELKANHTSILTPSEKDKYKERKHISKPQLTGRQILADTIYTQYGVKINNTIKLFHSKDACMGYIECYRQFDNTKDLAIVNLSIKYI